MYKCIGDMFLFFTARVFPNGGKLCVVGVVLNVQLKLGETASLQSRSYHCTCSLGM